MINILFPKDKEFVYNYIYCKCLPKTGSILERSHREKSLNSFFYLRMFCVTLQSKFKWYSCNDFETPLVMILHTSIRKAYLYGYIIKIVFFFSIALQEEKLW